MARKILLADDSVTAQNMGRKILADAGYDVVTVNNGSAALKRIAENKPDLIVLDVYMPGYSGLEVCQRLKDAAETAHIPVLLTVGKLEPFKADEARRVRADAHIVKPFEASELLTAITRLEDRMVPQQSDGTRFSSSVTGMERFSSEENGRKTDGDTDPDSGWKSRLRFPSKKKKEEPEPESEDAAAGATFRDFRKTRGKAGASGVFSVKPPAPLGQEPGLVPDIPRDITPEELDALSALAEKLDGPIPAAENIAPLAEKMGPAEAPATEAVEVKVKAEVSPSGVLSEVPSEVPPEVKNEAETPAPVAADAKLRPEEKGAVEIPVEHVEPSSEGAADSNSAAVEKLQRETPQVEAPHAVAAVAVNTALFAQEPAPVDRNDEPAFASAANAGPATPSTEEMTAAKMMAAKSEEKSAEAIAKTEVSAPAETVALQVPESKSEESKPPVETRLESRLEAELKSEALKGEKNEEWKTQKIERPAAASVPETAEAEEPAPTEEELAEALRLLTPSTGQQDVATLPSHGTLVAAGQLLAEEAARNAAAGPRWMAEPVALTPEEASISLEGEMFRTFAATFQAAPAAASGDEIEAPRFTGVSAIAAAVENRLAEAEMAASSRVPPERRLSDRRLSEHGPAGHGSTAYSSAAPASEASLTEAPADPTAAGFSAAAPVVRAIEKQTEEDKIAPDKTASETTGPETIEAERKDSTVQVAKPAPAEEIAAATFAEAVGKDEDEDEVATAATENTAVQNNDRNNNNNEEAPVTGITVAEAMASAAAEDQDSNSEVGGRESMGKDVKAKSGKSNWHQIHTPSASAAANNDVVEAAKQAEHAAEEAPKAMAAAASAEGSASVSATDASTIASIVDSVMANLRPKIVEEITRKLTGK